MCQSRVVTSNAVHCWCSQAYDGHGALSSSGMDEWTLHESAPAANNATHVMVISTVCTLPANCCSSILLLQTITIARQDKAFRLRRPSQSGKPAAGCPSISVSPCNFSMPAPKDLATCNMTGCHTNKNLIISCRPSEHLACCACCSILLLVLAHKLPKVSQQSDCCMLKACTFLASRAELQGQASAARLCQALGQLRHQHSPPIWYKTVEYRPGTEGVGNAVVAGCRGGTSG